MKNIIIISSILLLAFAFVGCSSPKEDTSKQKTKKEVKGVATTGFSIDPASIKVGFTAFKTTAKVPVKGSFVNLDKDNITSAPISATAERALDKVNFNIPISRLKTGNEARDFIIKKHFFGLMVQTDELVGSLQVDANNTEIGTMALRMNNVTFKFPIKIAYANGVAAIKGVMNLNDWNTTDAQASLHKNCEDKHKGDDGVSKTWSEVVIEGSVSIIKK